MVKACPIIASHASVFRGARFFVGRDEKRAPLKTPAWEASPIKAVLALIYHDVIDDVLFLPP